jgi:hypothetical protein
MQLRLANRQNQHHRFVASSKNSRGDLIAVFGKADLENAGFAANVDTSGLRGDYTVSLVDARVTRSLSAGTCNDL